MPRLFQPGLLAILAAQMVAVSSAAPVPLRAVPSAAVPSAAVTFEADVRPILKAHCWQCHGEERELKGGLDARLARFLLRGGESGPVIVAGRHAESLLYQRVSAGEMPPEGKKLSLREIDILARWIDQGARRFGRSR